MFDFKKTPHRYAFSIAIICSCETVWSKGAFIKRMDGCSQKSQYTTTAMEKTNREGGRFKVDEFSGVVK